MINVLTPQKLAIKIAICLAVLVAIMFLCTMVGTQEISLKKALAGPGEKPGENIDYEILIKVRLPRVILAVIVGAALAAKKKSDTE